MKKNEILEYDILACYGENELIQKPLKRIYPRVITDVDILEQNDMDERYFMCKRSSI